MDSRITEIQKVLGDTVRIIESQVKVSPYWMLGHEFTVKLTVGDINRLYYALDLTSIILNGDVSESEA